MKNGGAFLQVGNGKPRPLHVGEKRTLNSAVIAMGFSYDKDGNPDNNSDNLARILPHVRGIRCMGAAAYNIGCVAAGLLDGFWELGLHEWDICAANPLVTEAGGIVRALRPDRSVSIVAGNADLVKQIVRYVR